MSEWIEWNGGECPVGDDCIVSVSLGSGYRSCDKASGFYWEWAQRGNGGDIVNYKIEKHNPTKEWIDSQILVIENALAEIKNLTGKL